MKEKYREHAKFIIDSILTLSEDFSIPYEEINEINRKFQKISNLSGLAFIEPNRKGVKLNCIYVYTVVEIPKNTSNLNEIFNFSSFLCAIKNQGKLALFFLGMPSEKDLQVLRNKELKIFYGPGFYLLYPKFSIVRVRENFENLSHITEAEIEKLSFLLEEGNLTEAEKKKRAEELMSYFDNQAEKEEKEDIEKKKAEEIGNRFLEQAEKEEEIKELKEKSEEETTIKYKAKKFEKGESTKKVKTSSKHLEKRGNDLIEILYSSSSLEIETFGLFLPYPFGYSILAGPKGSGKSTFAKYIISLACKEKEVFPFIISKEENMKDILQQFKYFNLPLQKYNIIDFGKFYELVIKEKQKPSLTFLIKLLRKKEKFEIPALVIVDPLSCIREFSFLKSAKSANYYFGEDEITKILNTLREEKIIILGIVHSPKNFNPEILEQNPLLAIQGAYGGGSLSDFGYGYGVLIPNFELQTSAFIYQVKNSPWLTKNFDVKLLRKSNNKTFCTYEYLSTTSSYSQNTTLSFQKDKIKTKILEIFYKNEKPLFIKEIHNLLEKEFPEITYDQVKNRIIKQDRQSLLKLNFITHSNEGYKLTPEGKLFYEFLKNKNLI